MVPQMGAQCPSQGLWQRQAAHAAHTSTEGTIITEKQDIKWVNTQSKP